MLRNFTILFALIAEVVNAFLAGLSRGHEVHIIKYGLYSYGFESLTFCYLYICFFLFIFILGKLLERELLSNIICLGALLLLFYSYKYIYLQMKIFSVPEEPWILLYRDSIFFVLISFLLVLILLVYQIISISKYFVKKNKVLSSF